MLSSNGCRPVHRQVYLGGYELEEAAAEAYDMVSTDRATQLKEKQLLLLKQQKL